MTNRPEFSVTYRKWPSKLHWSVPMSFICRDGDALWLGTRQGAPITRDGPTAYASGDSVVLFEMGRPWSPRWYRRPTASGRASRFSCYVDIVTGVDISESAVDVIDLDLDVAVTWEGEIVVLDEDEFAERSVARAYPLKIVALATSACQEVRDSLTRSMSPFGGQHRAAASEWFGECDGTP